MVNVAALLALARSLQKGVARGVARGTCRRLLARLSDFRTHRVRHHAANNGNASGDVASVLLAGVGLDAVTGLHAIVHAVADGENVPLARPRAWAVFCSIASLLTATDAQPLASSTAMASKWMAARLGSE